MRNTREIGEQGLLHRLGGTQLGVWAIKHIVSPLDRLLYRWAGGRGIAFGHSLAPRLLLTTTGRRTGVECTVPVFYLCDGDRLVVCNVNPGFERPNPWTMNLRANPLARVQMGQVCGTYYAREATADEVARYWPQLVRIWPAYQTHYDRSGQRSLFILVGRQLELPAILIDIQQSSSPCHTHIRSDRPGAAAIQDKGDACEGRPITQAWTSTVPFGWGWGHQRFDQCPQLIADTWCTHASSLAPVLLM